MKRWATEVLSNLCTRSEMTLLKQHQSNLLKVEDHKENIMQICHFLFVSNINLRKIHTDLMLSSATGHKLIVHHNLFAFCFPCSLLHFAQIENVPKTGWWKHVCCHVHRNMSLSISSAGFDNRWWHHTILFKVTVITLHASACRWTLIFICR